MDPTATVHALLLDNETLQKFTCIFYIIIYVRNAKHPRMI